MDNRNPAVNPQNFVKLIVIIHLALFMGQVVFAALALFISDNTALNLKPGNDPLFYISPVLVVFGIFTGSFMFKQAVAKVAEKPSLSEKLSAYQTALIIRYALSEGPSLFGIVCMLLTHNLYYLIVVGVNILYFIIIRPTKFKIQDDLNLAYDEQTELDANNTGQV
jgi:F0F1-type ATP synthase membrane subunit c/vacuolar-type H+-ATPase subunit K